MRKALLVTAAMTALVGGTTLAAAQNGTPGQKPGESTVHSQGVQPKGASGGAMSNPQHAAPMPGKSAQGPQTTPERHQAVGQEQRHERVGQGAGNGETPRAEEQNHETTPRVGSEQTKPENNGMNSAREHNNGQEHMGQTNAPAGGPVKLSESQRTRIQHIVGHNRSARVAHPDFSVTVGATIPRHIHLAVLPPDIVTIVPEYRGFDYIVVGDEILIVDPASLEIVAIIPA